MASFSENFMLLIMKNIPQIYDITHLMRNLIRTGNVAEVDLEKATCRVNTGDNVTDWMHWLTSRAGFPFLVGTVCR